MSTNNNNVSTNSNGVQDDEQHSRMNGQPMVLNMIKQENNEISEPLTNGHGENSVSNGMTSIPVAVPLDRKRLKELIQQVDPNEILDNDVEDILLELADDFIEALAFHSCSFAKHRKSNKLEVRDILFALDKHWNMWLPGFGVDGVVGVFSGTTSSSGGSGTSSSTPQSSNNANQMNRAPKKCLATEAHKQRLALIKKITKKY